MSTEEHRARLIRDTMRWPRHKGKAEYLRFLRGEPLTRSETIAAMCYLCAPEETGPCYVTGCPLTLHSPRNRQRKAGTAQGDNRENLTGE